MCVALIVGGAKGIGRAAAIGLAEAGHDIVVTYLNSRTETEETAAAVAAMGRDGIAVPLDVTDSHAVQQTFDNLDHGIGFPGIVVANAGVTSDSLVYNMTDQQFLDPIAVSLGGTFHLFRSAISGMRRRRWGRLIAVSSMAAVWGRRGAANYAASKAGIHGFVRSLAKEVGRLGITVNAVAPGVIATGGQSDLLYRRFKGDIDRIAVRRLGQPEEIAAAIRFLASREASYVTGAVLPVDGGLTP